MKGSNQLKDGAIYTGVFFILLLATLFIPVISFITLFLLPIPFFLFASRNGWVPSLILLSIVIPITVLLASIYTLPFTMIAGLGGVFLGSAINQKKSPYEAWALGSVGYIVGIVFSYLFSMWFMNVDWMKELRSGIDESLQNSKELVRSINGDVSESQMKLIEEQFTQIPTLLPSIMAIIAVVFAFITLWLGFKMLNKQVDDSYSFPPIRKLAFPKAVLWYYFIALIITFVGNEEGSLWNDAAQNAYVLTGAFITVQGFSFMFAYAHYKKLSKAIPIVGVVVTLLFSFLLLYPVRILGIIDLGFALRERLSKK